MKLTIGTPKAQKAENPPEAASGSKRRGGPNK